MEINWCVALPDYDDVTAETCGRNINCSVAYFVCANVKHYFQSAFLLTFGKSARKFPRAVTIKLKVKENVFVTKLSPYFALPK